MAEASPGQLTRQQIYDRIRETSKDEHILAEMKRLGFWKEGQGKPQPSEQIIKRKGDLERELRDLMKTQRMLDDPERALKEFRKQRMAEALAKREETKRRRAQERHERSVKWHRRKQDELVYLGAGVSAGLEHKQPDLPRLRAQGLPVLHNAKALATAMGIPLSELRFLSFARKTSKVNHYKRFLIAKKTGGTRLISAPMPRLKRAQYWILDNILLVPALSDNAHGFVPGRSIVSNAAPHIGQDIVINLDLKDFFPTIGYRRVKGLYIKLGYSEEIATVLALISSEPQIDDIELDGALWHLAKGERFLPQGAPTSPAISNLICRRLDKRLLAIARKFGFQYTRYADDLTFSAQGPAADDTGRLLGLVADIVPDEGFTVHPDKTRVMRKGRRQEVTGLIVNHKLGIDRRTLKLFRALLFQIEKDGPEGKSWGDGNLFSAIQGFANYVAMVAPEKGEPLKARTAAICEQHGGGTPGHPATAPLNKKHFRKNAAQGQAPRPDWWQAKPTPIPEREKTDQEIKEERAARRKQNQKKAAS